MVSVFEEADRQANPGPNFWQDYDFSHFPDIESNTVFEGELQIMKDQHILKPKNIILTKTSIYLLSSSNQPKRVSNISWKPIEAFTEEKGTIKRYGFRLGKGKVHNDFYVSSSEDLDTWLNFLNSICILQDLEEDFMVIKKIGKGNYARVYLIQDVDDFEEYALKSISKKKLFKSTRGVSAVVNEISIMKKLNHSNLVNLHRVYESDKHVHLILDYVPGGDLFQRLMKREYFSEINASCFIKNLLEGLNYLHSLNIAHRDLKPENILMVSSEDDTEIKIVDFGLASEIKEDGFLKCGSPGYVAPEILRNMPYGTKIDIFSAGIILYILLSGRVPFGGNKPQDVLLQNKQCKIFFKAKHWKNISRQGIDLVLKMTDPNPGLRISAQDALTHPWIIKHRSSAIKDEFTLTQSQPILLSSDLMISHAMMERLNSSTRRVPNPLQLQIPLFKNNLEAKEEPVQTGTNTAFQLLVKLRENDVRLH